MSYNIDGWVEDKDAVDSVTETVGVFGAAVSFLTETGKGKKSLPYLYFDKLGVPFPFRNQGNVGSCVAHGTACGVDTLKIIEIANGDREEFKAPTAEEPIYYGARVVIGGNKIRGDGAVVAYAIRYIHEYGTLAKAKYGSIDITDYSVERCKKWGTGSGFPKTLESISKETTVGDFKRVRSWEEYRDSLYNGYPVVFGSSYGFSNETDSEGFCKQNTTWHHCMAGIGMDDESKRPGGLINNSWPKNWLKIRNRKHNQPDGSFWADADDIDKICRNGDAWSIADFNGYKKRADMSVAW